MSTLSHSPWFVGAGAELPAVGRVFCFAHAGGNPRTFLSWQPAMHGEAELVAVTMPGRDHRIDERRPASIAEFADGAAEAISAVADRPIVLFGHSLGALLAFEVARRLGDLPELCQLVASGCSAPSLLPSRRVVEASRLEGQAFVDAVGFFGGLPPEIMAAEELREILLPGIQADFRLVAGYRYAPGAPLPVGITLINGRDDPHIGSASLQPWRHETRLPAVYRWAAGDHFYFARQPHAVVDVLRSVIQVGPGATPSGQHVEVI